MSTHFPLSLASLGAFVLAGVAMAQPVPNPTDVQKAHPTQLAVPSPSDVQTNTCTSNTASADAPPKCPDDTQRYGGTVYRAPLNSMGVNGNAGAGAAPANSGMMGNGTTAKSKGAISTSR
jgi:hypothetical protein